MFVPLHRRRPPASGERPGRPVRARVVLAVLTAVATTLVGSLFGKKQHADGGDYVVLGLVIAVAAVAGGVAVARTIGRQGKL